MGREDASLSTSKAAYLKNKKSCSKAKPIAGKLVWRKKLPSAKKKNSRACKCDKSKDVVVKENELKLLIDILPKALVELVIDYFKDDAYPITVSTHKWLIKGIYRIAVDSARLYVLTHSEGLKGLNHSLGTIKENERHLIEFGNHQWSSYDRFSSSHDGRYVSFGHLHYVSASIGEQAKYSTKWFTQSDGLECGRPKRVTFGGENSISGILSRDGQTLCSKSYADSTARVYQTKEHAERDPIEFIKMGSNSTFLAVSGKGNRVMVANREQLEIHDIGKDASKQACQIDMNIFWSICALNEDGSGAVFAKSKELRIVEVDKVFGVEIDQPAIAKIKVPDSVGHIYKIVYAGEDKLHVLHAGSKVSLFDLSTKEFILLEAPQEGQKVMDAAIFPNAEYIAILQESEKDQPFTCTTIVKRKLENADLKGPFGFKVAKP